MNNSSLPSRTVGLARTTTLKRGSGLARQAMSRTGVRKAASAPRQAPKTGDWSPEVRERVAQRSQGQCEVCGCNPATDLHHRRPRRTRDHRVVNAIHACRTCHRGIHQHPAEAREYGWIVPTWDDPATVPLLVNGNRWVLLQADGSYRTWADGWAA